jgi:hypothetical protein
MHLKAVHLVFISCATLLAGLLGGWSLAQQGAGLRTVGVVSLLVALALPIYGRWFWREILSPSSKQGTRRRRKLLEEVPTLLATLTLGAFTLATPRAVVACTTCYGEAEGPLIESARASVLFLLAVVVLVQIAIAAFFLHLRRRARSAAALAQTP